MDLFDFLESQSTIYDERQVQVVCAVCSEALRPIINAFATDRTKQTYDKVIELLKKTEPATGASRNQLLTKLASLPESDADDSLTSAYYVMRVLGICVDSLNYAMMDACYGLFSMCSDIDFVTNNRGSDSSLEKKTEALIKGLADNLSKSTDYSVLHSELAQDLLQFNMYLEDLMPAFIAGNNWSMG